MCGIAGEIRFVDDGDWSTAGQLAPLRHRGPDAEGAFARGPAWVGQTRLAILDLATGDPPITNEDGTIGVTLNGEIYNFRELRTRLRKQGHVFSTDGDTEVLAHLAEDLGPADLARSLDGMFACAIWDSARARLVLARDRFGKKPLYYWTDDTGRLVFGSEIKSLLANARVPKRLRPDAIPAYLTFGYVPTPETFFEGIKSVPPGHVLIAEAGGRIHLERYWQPAVPGIDGVQYLDLTLADASRKVRELLDMAVARRLVSDVPLGAFLSGGIDSTAIVGLMSRHLDRPVEAFTIGFTDSDAYDERPYARVAARAFGVNHHEFVVQPDAVELADELVWFHDQPFGDSSAIPTFLLSRLTREHVTVALTGDGGDELFAGYERFAAARLAQSYAGLPSLVRRTVRAGADLIPPDALRGRGRSLQRFVNVADRKLPDALLSWVSYVGRRERGLLLESSAEGYLDGYRSIWQETEGAHVLDRLLNLNIRTYLLDDLLVKADRMSMAHALEVRSPFLDTELYSLVTRLMPGLKMRGLRLKRVLREAVGDLVPREILGRRKRGFAVPLARWFRADLDPYVRSTLGTPHASTKRYLAPAAIDQMLAEHRAGRHDHGHALWTLLTLELFLRRHGW